jgi:hypothetical protein
LYILKLKLKAVKAKEYKKFKGTTFWVMWIKDTQACNYQVNGGYLYEEMLCACNTQIICMEILFVP